MVQSRRSRKRSSRRDVRFSYYFERGFQHTKESFTRLALLFVLLRLPGFVAVFATYLYLEGQPIAEMDPYVLPWLLVATYTAYFGLNSLLTPIGVAVAYRAAVQNEQGVRWTLFNELSWVGQRLSSVLFVGLAYYGVVNALGMIMAGISLGFVLTPFLIIDEGLFAVLVAQLGVFILLAFVLVLGLVFTLRYGLALVDAVAVEHSNVWGHFASSARLMRGAYLWATLLIVILGVVQTGVVFLGVQFVSVPSISGSQPNDFWAVFPALLRTQLLQDAVAQLITSIVSIYVSMCWALFYLDRRSVEDAQRTGMTAMPADS